MTPFLLRCAVEPRSRFADCLRISEEDLCSICGVCPGIFGYKGCGIQKWWHESRCEEWRRVQDHEWSVRASVSAGQAERRLLDMAKKLPREAAWREQHLMNVTWSPVLVPWIWLAAEEGLEAGAGSTRKFVEHLADLFGSSPVRLDTMGLDGAEVLRGAWNETVQAFRLMGIQSADGLAASIRESWPSLRRWTEDHGPYRDRVPQEAPRGLEPWCHEYGETMYMKDYVQDWIMDSVERTLEDREPDSCQHIVLLPRIFCALLDALATPVLPDPVGSEVSTAWSPSVLSTTPQQQSLQSLETAPEGSSW